MKIDSDLISSNCTTTKPPRHGLKIIVDGETTLNDVLYWGLRKFHCWIKNMDNIKILLLDTNDTKKQKLIHVSENSCAWVLNDAVGENFGNPLTLFVHDKNQKKKEYSTCSTDLLDWPFKLMINRQFFNDHHITSTPHFLNWHGHAFAMIQVNGKNRSMTPQLNNFGALS